MIRTELPLPHAFRSLQNTLGRTGVRQEESVFFALTWMAAARLVLAGRVPDVSKLEDLSDAETWRAVERAGLPMHGVKWWLGMGSSGSAGILTDAAGIVQALASELGNQQWDVLPVLSSAVVRMHSGSEGVVSSAVSELMLDMLGEPRGDLWIPFDFWGVLAVRALRRGWRVNAASMVARLDSPLPLLLAIEHGALEADNLTTVIERDLEGRPVTRASRVLAVPPFGANVKESRLIQWASGHRGAFDRYHRSEAWVVDELLNRVSKQAVFLLPPGFLFARGQEERLREHLLYRAGEQTEVQTIVALPGGALSDTSAGTAIVSMTPGTPNAEVLMVDLGFSNRSVGNIDELVRTHRDVVLGQRADDERARRVTPVEIEKAETSFMPSRYLHKAVEIGPNAVPLESLCELIRPPMISRDENSLELLELGIPELGSWAPIQSGLQKTVRVKHKHGSQLLTLQEGDVILSIKGSIGKAGLVGSIEGHSVAVSQSCLGIRILPVERTRISPEYLLMFLKSDAGQAQLESLRAGAAIQHVSPQSLLTSFMVPVPPATEQEAVVADYRRLCQMESSIDDIQQQMSEIAASRWAL